MTTVKVSLNSIGKVKSFVNAIAPFDYDFDLISGRYVIDAKSIMGIFSLDLSKPIDLTIHSADGKDEDLSEVMEALQPYVVEA
ncbi:MAG: HPr family phosphocarrier protein [Clostridiales bacterium]|nr:HPr family phosphocarrier protein [Clostridiales bacterium]